MKNKMLIWGATSALFLPLLSCQEKAEIDLDNSTTSKSVLHPDYGIDESTEGSAEEEAKPKTKPEVKPVVVVPVKWPKVNHKQRMAGDKINSKIDGIVIEEWVSSEVDVKGKFVVIDFWATWCGPCRRLIPHMNKMAAHFKDDNIVFLALSNESAAKVAKMKKPVIKYPSAVDTKARLKNFFRPRGIPFCAIIDPQGNVAWQGHPGYLNESVVAAILEGYAKAQRGE